MLTAVPVKVPLLVKVGPITRQTWPLITKVAPVLISVVPSRLSCAPAVAVLLFVVLSMTKLGRLPRTRKLKLVTVAAVPAWSVPFAATMAAALM